MNHERANGLRGRSSPGPAMTEGATPVFPAAAGQPDHGAAEAAGDQARSVAMTRAPVVPLPAMSRPPATDAWNALSPLGWPHGVRLRRRLAGGTAAHRGLAAIHPYDVLRTRALQAVTDAGWARLGVTQSSPGPAAPATALNLALAVARRPDQRVVLLDLDVERQQVLALLGHSLPASTAPIRCCRSRLLENLAVVSFATASGRGSETLLSPQFHRHVADLLGELEPDLVIAHVPPMLAGDAGIAGVEMVDTVLIAVDGTQDTAATVKGAERLVAARRPLLGLFLYDAEG